MEVRAGQHLELSGLEPALGVGGVALAAAAVVARVVGKDLLGAVIALPEMSAEGFGAAGDNVGDSAAMRRQHGRAMGRQVGVRKTAEDVGDLEHDRRQRPAMTSSRSAVSDARVGSVKWV